MERTMNKSEILNRVAEILRAIFWTSRREREAFEFQTEEHLKMARLLKEEREKINLAKSLLFELEKSPDSNSKAIQNMKSQISEKENLMNQNIYPGTN
jgi:hypothetical protein